MKRIIFTITKTLSKKINFIWSEEEDKKLLNLVNNKKRKNIDWKKISSFFKNKKSLVCFKRYKLINPIVKKGRWTREEDNLLLNLIKQYGNSWAYLSRLMVNRTSKQIRNRYDENLNPLIRKNKFTDIEDRLIIKLNSLFGNNWSKYINYLPDRSLKVIKRRFLRLKKLGKCLTLN